ncbi:MAG: translation initiation factor IF-2, partial [Candidatus Babeliales bacterium]
MRIYEIAKELGVSSKDVMSFLKSLSVDFSNHMSVLPDNVALKVRQRFSESKKTEEKSKKEFEKKEVITSSEKRSDTKIEPKKQVFKEEPKVKNIVHQTREIAKEEVNILPEEKPVYVPKKSDYIAEPLQLAEEELIDEVIEKNKISKLLTNKIGLEKRVFRPGRRRKRRKKQVSVAPDVKIVKEMVVDKSLPLFEVADLLGKQSGELIMALMRKGMVCNRNHILSTDIIKSLADHFGVAILAPQKTDADKIAKLRTETGTSVHRWPVVVVMGHVDHGKTTLLDYIRKMNVAGSEKGGITQHLGAYEVDSKHGKIVFIDTPGHEAFSHMREKGAKITDIAILVVAVDDGIMPQTVEAINHAKASGVPIIVAINKIDKNSSPAALETIKRQLAKYELMSEDWGGSVVVVPISAKTGQGVNELLEMVVLQSQLMDLKADISVPARAFILESKVEKGLGPVATVICTQGTLKQGDYFTCGASTGRVRVLINSQGKRITQVLPSIPAQVVGFDNFATVSDWLTVVPQD